MFSRINFNICSEMCFIFSYVLIGYLQAPNFTVETDGKMAKLSIPNPPRVRWSGQLLSEVLETDNPMYTIQYWLKVR